VIARTVRRLRAVIVATALIGCANAAAPGTATIDTSNGSVNVAWSARPTARDPALALDGQKLCIEDGGMLRAGGVTLVVHDQRGPDAAVLVWTNRIGVAECFVFRLRDGSLSTLGGAGADDLRLGGRLTPNGVADDQPVFWMTGETGFASRVLVDLEDGTIVEASTGRGRFAAWWPHTSKPVRLRSFDDAGTLVETYVFRPLPKPP
jgi:hypothetical protein